MGSSSWRSRTPKRRRQRERQELPGLCGSWVSPDLTGERTHADALVHESYRIKEVGSLRAPSGIGTNLSVARRQRRSAYDSIRRQMQSWRSAALRGACATAAIALWVTSGAITV